MLEGLAVAVGASLGLALGARARQTVQDERTAHESASWAPQRLPFDLVANPSVAVDRPGSVMTVMLVGDSGSGKTMLLTRLQSDGELGRETLPRTMAPSWHRLDLDMPDQRVVFQVLDTPGTPELSELLVPFYRVCNGTVLMFDVSSALSYARMQRAYETVCEQRVNDARAQDGSIVVLAHIIDERRERQVTRRDASSWCTLQGLPYFETHAKDAHSWRRMLMALANACIVDHSAPRLEGRGSSPNAALRRGAVVR